MMKFIIRGIIRDRSRSLFPIIIISAGVLITVLTHAWMNGMTTDMLYSNAIFQTGHVKVMSAAYAEQADQAPNDLALMGIDVLKNELQHAYPDFIWLSRIRFGGLIDIPDENGETKSQGPVFGLAIDLFNPDSPEKTILNLKKALVRGQLPKAPGEILMSDQLAIQLKIEPGQNATLISSTMYGSMAMVNYKIAGTINFGVAAMDRGAIIADLTDIQIALDMENSAGEILGIENNFLYSYDRSRQIQEKFNLKFDQSENEFHPYMVTLNDQNGLGEILEVLDIRMTLFVSIFLFAMFIVLWNAGLMGSLRRYGEIGVRLAMGENKQHLYGAMLLESIVIGIMGSALGTLLGLSAAYYMQVHGFDFGYMMKNSSILISNVMRAQITPGTFYIGFFPGLLATFLGSAVSGFGIFKRQTSQLFKELEV